MYICVYRYAYIPESSHKGALTVVSGILPNKRVWESSGQLAVGIRHESLLNSHPGQSFQQVSGSTLLRILLHDSGVAVSQNQGL